MPDSNVTVCDHLVGYIPPADVKPAEWNNKLMAFIAKVVDFNERGQRVQINHPGFIIEFKFCPECGCKIDRQALGILSYSDAFDRFIDNAGRNERGMAVSDFLMPVNEPARTIYIAFERESRKRSRRSEKEWIEAERQAVHQAAVLQAHKMGLYRPTIQEIEAAELYAMGSADYGAKWAYRVVDIMRKETRGM